MDLIGAIVAGLVGTAVMTLLMYMGPMMGMPKMDMLGMLGTMFTTGGSAHILGGVVHFVMGAVFGVVYAFLWASVIGAPTWLWGLIFGLVHGVVALVTMPMMIRMHPRPPEGMTSTSPMMAAGMIIGHIVFGIVVALTYAAFV